MVKANYINPLIINYTTVPTSWWNMINVSENMGLQNPTSIQEEVIFLTLEQCSI